MIYLLSEKLFSKIETCRNRAVCQFQLIYVIISLKALLSLSLCLEQLFFFFCFFFFVLLVSCLLFKISISCFSIWRGGGERWAKGERIFENCQIHTNCETPQGHSITGACISAGVAECMAITLITKCYRLFIYNICIEMCHITIWQEAWMDTYLSFHFIFILDSL